MNKEYGKVIHKIRNVDKRRRFISIVKWKRSKQTTAM